MSVFRAANLLMAVLFLTAAALQYNDPDPEVWMPFYLGAAAACLVPYRRALWPLAAVMAGIALLWAASLAPAVLPGFAFGDMFRSMSAGNPTIELSRELLGLVIVAAWMLALTAAARVAPSRAR
ncbi:MAG: transmembrane 220 family protein [Candidatus Rokuibacteriota bacterium]